MRKQHVAFALLVLGVTLVGCGGSATAPSSSTGVPALTPSVPTQPPAPAPTVKLTGEATAVENEEMTVPIDVTSELQPRTFTVRTVTTGDTVNFGVSVNFSPLSKSGRVTWDFGAGKGVTHSYGCAFSFGATATTPAYSTILNPDGSLCGPLQRALTPTYSYDKAGTYTAIIVADNGLVTRQEVTVTVLAKPAVATPVLTPAPAPAPANPSAWVPTNIFIGGPYSGVKGQSTSLGPASILPVPNATEIQAGVGILWDYSDGDYSVQGVSYGWGITHTYRSCGTFPLRVYAAAPADRNRNDIVARGILATTTVTIGGC
jgi:hypothetical protein